MARDFALPCGVPPTRKGTAVMCYFQVSDWLLPPYATECLLTWSSQFGHINLCRCTEYDDRVVQHRAVASSDYFREDCSIPPKEVLPYATIYDHLWRYDGIVSDKDRASLLPPHNVKFPLGEQEQIEGASRHATSLIFAVSTDQKWLNGEATPDLPMDLRKRYLKNAMERFKESIDQYPIEDVLDASITVPIEDSTTSSRRMSRPHKTFRITSYSSNVSKV